MRGTRHDLAYQSGGLRLAKENNKVLDQLIKTWSKLSWIPTLGKPQLVKFNKNQLISYLK